MQDLERIPGIEHSPGKSEHRPMVCRDDEVYSGSEVEVQVLADDVSLVAHHERHDQLHWGRTLEPRGERIGEKPRIGNRGHLECLA